MGQRVRERAIRLLIAGGQLKRPLTFLSICWNFELTPRPSNPRRLCFLFTHEQSRLLPTTNSKQQAFLPQGLCTYPRTSPALPSSTRLSTAKANSFKTLPSPPTPNLIYKKTSPTPGQLIFSLFHLCHW